MPSQTHPEVRFTNLLGVLPSKRINNENEPSQALPPGPGTSEGLEKMEFPMTSPF
jgi:hypothetical protein